MLGFDASKLLNLIPTEVLQDELREAAPAIVQSAVDYLTRTAPGLEPGERAAITILAAPGGDGKETVVCILQAVDDAGRPVRDISLVDLGATLRNLPLDRAIELIKARAKAVKEAEKAVERAAKALRNVTADAEKLKSKGAPVPEKLAKHVADAFAANEAAEHALVKASALPSLNLFAPAPTPAPVAQLPAATEQ